MKYENGKWIKEQSDIDRMEQNKKLMQGILKARGVEIESSNTNELMKSIMKSNTKANIKKTENYLNRR